jgi:NAD(P)-dependent dehydrogenase (short-subunit alcohol dehydrogenase family)
MNAPVVLITGALTGIGRATALAFAKEGARIAVSGRRDDAGQKLVAELRAIALRRSIGVQMSVMKMTCAA